MTDKKTIGIGFLILIAGIGAGYYLAGGSDRKAGGHMMADGSIMQQNIDQHFIVQMIPHHEGAIEMAKLAQERSKRPEMLALANDIIEAQTREINDMRGWYESWFGVAPPTDGMMGGMHMDGMTGDMEELEATSDTEFDREFIRQMIPHHEMAVMMAQMLDATTERAEMKQLANDIITSQTREIQMMRSWLASWY